MKRIKAFASVYYQSHCCSTHKMAKMVDRSFERKLEQLNKDPKLNSIAEYFEQFQVLDLNLNYFAF